MQRARLPSLSWVADLPWLFGTPDAHAAGNLLHDMALEFLIDEFVPTLLALAQAALREPMTWGLVAALALPSLLRRQRTSRPPR
jgi:hypothetical protein